MKLKNVRTFVFVSIVGLSLSSRAITGELRPNPNVKLAEAVVSSDWACDYVHKVNLAHGSDGAVASTIATIASVKCIGKNSEFGTYATFNVACLTSSREALPELNQCVQSPIKESKVFSWGSGSVYPKAKRSGADKYGRKCVYNTPDKKPRVAYRIHADGSYDAVCATPIACDNYNKGPKHWIVACKADQVPQKSGVSEEFCPQPADCVDEELPLTVPHANAELASFSKSIAVAPNEKVASQKKSH